MGYDLHMHSIYSDGTMSPSELVSRAIKRGLDGIALTDHDSIEGVAEALLEGERRRYPVIPGVELTTDYGESEVHILGYNFDEQDRKLREKLVAIVEYRNERAREILKKLQRHNIALSWEKVLEQTTSKFVGRTHIFKALEKAGLLNKEKSREAFEYYLGKNGLAYVPHEEIGTVEAIELVNNAGGIPVLAHPGRVGEDSLIRKLVGFGLKGLEVYYPSHTPAMVADYLKTAGDLHLIVTGGSDYHGGLSQNRLGESQVDEVSGWYVPSRRERKGR